MSYLHILKIISKYSGDYLAFFVATIKEHIMIIYRKYYQNIIWFFLLFLMAVSDVVAEKVEITDATFILDPTFINTYNSYWPLHIGATYGYQAITEDECEFNKMTVTPDTYVIEVKENVFVNTRVVRDQEWVTELDDDGNCDLTSAELLEDTLDFYALDDDGNIWYFGEDTLAKEENDEGVCSIVSDGSWEAGKPKNDPEVEPATAGIIMLDEPASGQRYQQEYLEDEAEDWAAVLRLNATVSITEGDYTNCLMTKEWTPLEPGEIEHKYYCLNPAANGYSPGLVFIEELKAKTVKVEFIGDRFPIGLPGDGDVNFPSLALSCD